MYIHLNLAQVGTLVQFEGTQIGSVKIESMKFRISIPVGPCNEKLMGSGNISLSIKTGISRWELLFQRYFSYEYMKNSP